MFLGMQDFDFAQILITIAQISPKFAKFCRKFAQILLKKFPSVCSCISCIPSPYGTDVFRIFTPEK